MPNTSSQAAAEGMPDTSRRRFLQLLPAPAALAAVPAPTIVAPGEAGDPLLDMINAYRSGLANFNQHAPEDDEEANAYAEVSYGPPFDALVNWTAPAPTREGAMAALRLAVEEGEHSYSEFIHPLTAAALAYFEQEGRI